jgi:hypothetical protein
MFSNHDLQQWVFDGKIVTQRICLSGDGRPLSRSQTGRGRRPSVRLWNPLRASDCRCADWGSSSQTRASPESFPGGYARQHELSGE